MHRYDLLFRNIENEAFDWIVGFVSFEAAKAYADHLRNARQDDNIVCMLYARTEEGDFYRYRGEGFSDEPGPESEPDAKLNSTPNLKPNSKPKSSARYIVVSESGSIIGRPFRDRQSAETFMGGYPGKRLRLRIRYPDLSSKNTETKDAPGKEETRDDFHPVRTPADVRYRYLVVLENGPTITGGRYFEDRQSARDFIDSHPGLLLRLRAQRLDGFAAHLRGSSSARVSRQVPPKPKNAPATNQRPSKKDDRSSPGKPPQGQTTPENAPPPAANQQPSKKGTRSAPGKPPQGQTNPADAPQSGGKRVLSGAAAFAAGAVAANVATNRADFTAEGVSPEVAALSATTAFGNSAEGASADAAFVAAAGKGVTEELAALEAMSAYANVDGEGIHPFAIGRSPGEGNSFADEGYSTGGYEDDFSAGEGGDGGDYY